MDSETRLEELLYQWEEGLERGQPRTPEELCADCPGLVEPLKGEIYKLERMEAALRLDEGHAGAEEAPRSQARPGELYAARSQFGILQFHKAGGLGEVYLAQSQDLGREVALKRMQGRFAQDCSKRSRFVQEAEITSRLEHPGIAPVYAMGQDEVGRPFYAMRFIRGNTLQEACEQFHQADQPGRGPAERALTFRQLLGRFVAVCNTVAYAHSRGVIHRDIKPGNIILGPFGETILLDWGLAKMLQNKGLSQNGDRTHQTHESCPHFGMGPPPDPAAGAPAGIPGESRQTSLERDAPDNTGTAVEATQLGVPVGTPPYMSPEQAGGNWDKVGPASDIYGLGATLYTLLTGRVPVTGKDAGEILHHVKQGDWVHPRQVKRAIPRALEAICLRAMAPRPLDRYPSASDLAADVEHWLADEAVTAWREPLSGRFRRWGRHHRATVAGAVMAVGVAAVSLTLATWLLVAAYEKEHRAKQTAERKEGEAAEQRDEAKRRKQQAEKSFQEAWDAVDFFQTQASQHALFQAPGLQPLRKDLLQRALKFYQKYIQEHKNDADFQADRARAFVRLADITRDIGAQKDALGAYRQAVSELERLVAGNPTNIAYAADLAAAYHNLATLWSKIGEIKQAESVFAKALARQQKVVALPSSGSKAQYDLAVLFQNLARLNVLKKKSSMAEQSYKRSLAILAKLTQTHANISQYQYLTAHDYMGLGLVYANLSKVEEAVTAFQNAAKVLSELKRREPTTPDYQTALGVVYTNLANLYFHTMRDLAKSEAARQAALAIQEQLVKQNPEVTQYRSDLAGGYYDLGLYYVLTRQLPKAKPLLEKALAFRQQLARENPGHPPLESELAESHFGLGTWHSANGENEQAIKANLLALAIQERLAKRFPGMADYRMALSRTYSNLGVAYNSTRSPQEAEAAFHKSLSIRNQLARDHPEVVDFAIGSADSASAMAMVATEQGRWQTALRWLNQAVGKLEAALRKVPRHARARQDLATAYARRARALNCLGRYAQALEDYERALGLDLKGEHSRLRVDRAATLARLGKYIQATREVQDLVEPQGVPAGLHYDVASVYALAAGAARRDPGIDPAQREKQAVQYAERAVQLLTKGQAAGTIRGPAVIEKLKQDKDFQALAEYKPFQRFVRNLK
jgi:serine/threonine-protein kinase